MNKDIKEKIFTITSEVFKVSKSQINESSCIGSLKNWDSLGHLNLMLEIESKLDIKFTTDQITSIKSIEDIIKEVETIVN